jgi:hypothetical protein
MNLMGLRRQIARIQARLAGGANEEFPVPRHGGMLALRMAIEAAKEARGEAKREPEAGERLGPIAALRRALLDEQARRAQLFAIMPIEKLAEQPAIYQTEETEEIGKCVVPTSNPEP